MNAPKGWKLVPVEPTNAMLMAVSDYRGECMETGATPMNSIMYGKFIAAAPAFAASEVARTDDRGETDRIMGIVRGTEGWHIFGFGSDGEFHYVRDGVSLCRRFAYTHGGDVFQPHIAKRSSCEVCLKEAPSAEGQT